MLAYDAVNFFNMDIPGGCITIQKEGERILELHTHSVDGIHPDIGGFVVVNQYYLDHEGTIRDVHKYDPHNVDPEKRDPKFNFDDAGVTVFEDCVPSAI